MTSENADDAYPDSFDWRPVVSFPVKWYAVAEGEHKDSPDHHGWTVSPDPLKPGWGTDCGYSGYGLPKWVAEAIAERLNQSDF